MCEILESTPAGGLHLPAVLTWSSSSGSSREIDSDNVDKCQICRGWEETGILLFVGLPPLLDSLLCINKLCINKQKLTIFFADLSRFVVVVAIVVFGVFLFRFISSSAIESVADARKLVVASLPFAE